MSASAKCEVCGKTAYSQESVKADNHTFHKSCFRCCQCNNVLKLGNYASLKGKYYCKPHFKQLFRLRGNYDEGFGGEQHKNKWITGERGTGSPAPVAAHEHPAAATHTEGASTSAPTPTPAASSSTPAAHEHPTERPEGGWSLHASDPKTFPSLSGLTMENVEAAQTAFKKYDIDGNGVIDKEELYKLIEDIMVSRGKHLGKVVLNNLTDMHMAATDKDKSGAIDEVEFLVLYSNLILEEEKGAAKTAT